MTIAIVNPIAGNGKALAVLEQVKYVLDESGKDYHIVQTQAPQHATALAKQAAKDGASRVISVGGDGTLTEIARGLIGTDVILGAVPAGTGNDYIRSIKIAPRFQEDNNHDNTRVKPQGKKGLQQAIEMAIYGKAAWQDAFTVNGEYCLNIASIGFDADVVEASHGFKKRFGMLGYAAGALYTLKHFNTIGYRMQIDHKQIIEGKGIILCFANGRYYGGGFHPIPHADMTDGILDIMTVEPVSRLFLLRFFLKYRKGKHVHRKECTFYQGKHISVQLDRTYTLNIDGELSHADSLDIQVIPRAILIASN